MNSSIVIPTHHRAESLRRTLASLALQSGDFEVVVVCDGEDSATRAVARELAMPYPLRWVWCSDGAGRAKARNLGAEAAEGELLLFLDDDTTVDAGWLSGHTNHHVARKNERIAVLGRLEDVYDSSPATCTERFLRQSRETWLAGLWSVLSRMDASAEAECWVGLNSSIRRADYLAVGGHDPRLTSVQEDSELAYRLLRNGLQFIYDGNLLVRHYNPRRLAEDHVRTAPSFAEADVYRVREKQQPEASRDVLARLHYGPLKRRLQDRAAWYLPFLARALAELGRAITDRMGWRRTFGIWYALSFSVGYWQSVKSQGLTLQEVHSLVGRGRGDSQLGARLSAPGVTVGGVAGP